MLQLGAYMPYDGQLVGIEVVNYMNGCKITTATNMPFQVERTYTATNTFF